MQSKSETTMPKISSTVRLVISSFLLMVTLVMSVGHPPYLILSAFFILQICVKVFSDKEGSGVSFKEAALIGPAKILAACFMIGSGIPDNNEGFFWIGCSLLILSSGIKNLHFVMRGLTGTVTPETRTVSAKQVKNAEKQDEALFADLAAFLDDSDSPNK